MAKSKKAVAQSAVEPTVETKEVEQVEVVEITQPSMLASMLQQEVKPLEETKAEETKPEVKVEKNQGVGAFVRKLIAEGLTNTAILKIVHEQYGNTNTTYACVAWYRNKMKKAGVVAKVSGRPGVSRRPAGRTQPASISTSSVPLEIWTPRIASISARLTGS